MSKRTLYLIVGLLAVVAVGCVPPPTEPNPQPNIEVCGGAGSCGGNTGPASPGPSASPTPSAGCPTVTHVTVGFSGAGGRTTTRVGVGEVLDVTPRTTGNHEVPSQCHGQTVQWTLVPPPGSTPPTPTAACQITGNTGGFNPTMTCSTVGSVQACANVAPPGGSACTTFTVNQ